MSIYSLSQTLDDQADLESLCRDRELCTEESFEPNAFYGVGFALRKYAGLPEDSPLQAIIPHGIVFDRNYLWQAERLARVPVVFNYMKHRDAVYETRARKYVMPSASPFLYAAALEGNAVPSVRSGTVFFPAHSTHRVTVQAHYGDVTDRLLALDERFKPITVCIYWKDYLLGAHQIFEERGIRVVSAGHIYDRFFLFRLYHLLRMHSYASSGTPGSHIFYSLTAGCKYFHLPEGESEYTVVDRGGARDQSNISGVSRVMLDLFSEPADLSGRAQLALYDELMGASNMLSPERLKEQILFADGLDRNGVALDERGRLYWTFLPMAWRRVVHKASIAVKQFARSKILVRAVKSD